MRMETKQVFLQEIKSKKAIELKFKTSNKQTINLFFLKQIFFIYLSSGLSIVERKMLVIEEKSININDKKNNNNKKKRLFIYLYL